MPPHPPIVDFVDLGRISYASAYEIQRQAHERVVAARIELQSPRMRGESAGTVYLLEHDPPVVTVSRRSGAAEHVLASPERLAQLGVELVETDRGGDVTWHGPGQVVAYLILDLNRLGLRIHGYLRLLEGAVIATVAEFGLEGRRDPSATGVWIGDGKVCAMGVRLSRWVSMHGIALNVDPDLSQFGLIVPCGLVGRSVTSLRRELGDRCPTVDEAKSALRERLSAAIKEAAEAALSGR
ncbi:MAG: lipoyl(octanoyl) transferase [Phycisphaerales bacterium]|nr:lipoyl(octanoyl) transferase [Phycisphaerales bacterium]